MFVDDGLPDVVHHRVAGSAEELPSVGVEGGSELPRPLCRRHVALLRRLGGFRRRSSRSVRGRALQEPVHVELEASVGIATASVESW